MLDAIGNLPTTIDVALALRTIALFALEHSPKVDHQGIVRCGDGVGRVCLGGETAQQCVGRIELLAASDGGGKYHDVVYRIADIVLFAEFCEQRQSDVRGLSA